MSQTINACLIYIPLKLHVAARMRYAHHLHTHKNQIQVLHVTACICCNTTPNSTKRQKLSPLLFQLLVQPAVILPWLQDKMQKDLKPIHQGSRRSIPCAQIRLCCKQCVLKSLGSLPNSTCEVSAICYIWKAHKVLHSYLNSH